MQYHTLEISAFYRTSTYVKRYRKATDNFINCGGILHFLNSVIPLIYPLKNIEFHVQLFMFFLHPFSCIQF